jgi:glycosyltransferase involved in cell wall biosynthesis
LTALLDEQAGTFSVPSKGLSYLCVARPLLLSVPAQNAAARVVWENACGLVVPPGDSASFIAAASRLRGDNELRERCSANAFAYARRTFDIHAIGERFNRIFHSLDTVDHYPIPEAVQTKAR